MMNDNDNNPCPYCAAAWMPLFRVVETYPCGETIVMNDECENCAIVYDESDNAPDCDLCDYRPYQPENHINITVAIVGDRLMFEDKGKPCVGDGDSKQYIPIKFCPMCGRKLEGESIS